MMGYQMVVSFR